MRSDQTGLSYSIVGLEQHSPDDVRSLTENRTSAILLVRATVLCSLFVPSYWRRGHSSGVQTLVAPTRGEGRTQVTRYVRGEGCAVREGVAERQTGGRGGKKIQCRQGKRENKMSAREERGKKQRGTHKEQGTGTRQRIDAPTSLSFHVQFSAKHSPFRMAHGMSTPDSPRRSSLIVAK